MRAADTKVVELISLFSAGAEPALFVIIWLLLISVSWMARNGHAVMVQSLVEG